MSASGPPRAGAAVILAVLLALAGCSWFSDEKPEKPPPPPSFFPVCVQLRSHPRLNWFRGEAHTLYARVFPLTTGEMFEAAPPDKLLADTPPMLPGLAGSPQGGDIYPGTTTTYTLGAGGGQEFSSVGVVAGYFQALGRSKVVVATKGVPTGACFIVDLGEAGIGDVTSPPPAPLPTPTEED